MSAHKKWTIEAERRSNSFSPFSSFFLGGGEKEDKVGKILRPQRRPLFFFLSVVENETLSYPGAMIGRYVCFSERSEFSDFER